MHGALGFQVIAALIATPSATISCNQQDIQFRNNLRLTAERVSGMSHLQPRFLTIDSHLARIEILIGSMVLAER